MSRYEITYSSVPSNMRFSRPSDARRYRRVVSSETFEGTKEQAMHYASSTARKMGWSAEVVEV